MVLGQRRSIRSALESVIDKQIANPAIQHLRPRSGQIRLRLRVDFKIEVDSTRLILTRPREIEHLMAVAKLLARNCKTSKVSLGIRDRTRDHSDVRVVFLRSLPEGIVRRA